MPKLPLPPAESITLDSLAEVARGGMGSVELARAMDGRLAGQVLAVKRLHPNIAEDPDFVSMFLDETWMTAALNHPNVARVMTWGNDAKGMFLAIELVQGVSLSRLMKEAAVNQEPFAERTVAYLCSQICGALSAAHTLAAPDGAPLMLVHRDLTPANVLVSFDGVVKVIDFGIAKAEERISHTRTGQLKGKPAYMAPEQQRGDAVDARADLFAFGVVMFELLTGRRPWTSKGAFDVMMEIANDPHPDLGSLRPGLNPEFVTIAHRCLEKKAEARFDSAAAIKARLDAWLSAKGFTADDQQSLANFVQRNCQPQVLWWQQALRGEHAIKKAPTFKELEEKIDEEREKAEKARRKDPPRRPPAALLSTVPMPAYTGSPTPNPASPSSRRPGVQAEANGPPASTGSAGLRGLMSTTPMVLAPSAPPPASPASPSSVGRRLITGAATEFLAQDLPGPATDRPQQTLERTLDEGEARVQSQAPPAPPPPVSAPSPALASSTADVAHRAAPVRKKSRAPVVLALCIAVAAGVAGGALLALGPGDAPPARPPPAKRK